MRRLPFIFLVFLCFIPAISPAKELPKIAVWDLAPGDIKPAYAQDLTSILVSEVSKLGKYEVYSQQNVRTLAGWTAERMQLGCTDTKCLTALGQMDIAKLISGRVGKIGNRYSVSLNLFDTQNAKAEKSISEFGRSEDELIDLVQVALRKLIGVEISPVRVEQRPSPSAGSEIGKQNKAIVRAETKSASEEQFATASQPDKVFPIRIQLDTKEFEVKDMADLMALFREGYKVESFLREEIPPLYPRLGDSLTIALVKIMEDENELEQTRGNAASVLGPMKAIDAIPPLVKLLKHPKLAQNAHDALAEIGKQAVPALAVALKDENRSMRTYATYTLRDIGPDAEAAVPALIDALKDHALSVRIGTADALGSIGPRAKAAIPALREALKTATGADAGSKNLTTSVNMALVKIQGE
jgi:HEAT repeat protein